MHILRSVGNLELKPSVTKELVACYGRPM